MDANASLAHIATKLRALGTNAGESEHIEADDLLVLALKCFSTPDTCVAIQEVVDAYQAMSKWYA